MARGVNKVILVGNVGADPETSSMPSGVAVTNISLATSERWKDKNTGEEQERTEWHRLSFFNRLAEIAGEYIKKGSQIYVEGQIRTNKYQDKKTGEDKFSTQIIVRDLQLLGSGSSDSTRGSRQKSAGGSPARQSGGTMPESMHNDFDEDIPF